MTRAEDPERDGEPGGGPVHGESDEELDAWRKDPVKSEGAIRMHSSGIRRKWLIVEVVKSHGCGNGLKVGDRLCFEAIARLDPGRSSRWCGIGMPRSLPLPSGGRSVTLGATMGAARWMRAAC